MEDTKGIINLKKDRSTATFQYHTIAIQRIDKKLKKKLPIQEKDKLTHDKTVLLKGLAGCCKAYF